MNPDFILAKDALSHFNYGPKTTINLPQGRISCNENLTKEFNKEGAELVEGTTAGKDEGLQGDFGVSR